MTSLLSSITKVIPVNHHDLMIEPTLTSWSGKLIDDYAGSGILDHDPLMALHIANHAPIFWSRRSFSRMGNQRFSEFPSMA